MQYWLLAVGIGYLLGSIPVGYIVGKLRGVDIRTYGSGATGGTNVLRTLGWSAALVTGFGDLFKGMLGAYVGWRLGGLAGYALGGCAAALGHSYPVWLRFRGGKGVATSGGVLLLMHPIPFVTGLAVGLGTILISRYVSLGSLVAVLVACGMIWLSDVPAPHKLMAAGAFAIVYVRHWENMKRLASGAENRYGQKAGSRPGA